MLILERLEDRRMLAGDDAGDTISGARLLGVAAETPLHAHDAIRSPSGPNIDVDIYSFEARSGQVVTIAVDSQGDGIPILRMFNGKGDELQRTMNTDDPVIERFSIADNGTYFIGVSEDSNQLYDPRSLANRARVSKAFDYSLTVRSTEASDPNAIEGRVGDGQQDFTRVITLSAPGEVDIRISPAEGSTLRPIVQLTDTAGSLITTASPRTDHEFDARLRQILDAGTYFVTVGSADGSGGDFRGRIDVAPRVNPAQGLRSDPGNPENNPRTCVVEDVNNDGFKDIVVAAAGRGTPLDVTASTPRSTFLSIFLGTADGAFLPPRIVSFQGENHPGTPSALVVLERSTAAPGSPTATDAWSTIAVAGVRSRAAPGRESTLETTLTLVRCSSSTPLVSIDTAFEAPRSDVSLDAPAPKVGLSHVTRPDGVVEIGIASGSSAKTYAVTTSRDTFAVTALSRLSLDASTIVSDLAFGDVDCDGVLDLIMSDQGRSRVLGFRRGQDGIFQATPFLTLSVDAAPVALACRDLDADGRIEIVTANLLDFSRAEAGIGQVSVCWNRPDGFDVNSLEVGGGPGALVITDVDNDDRPDIVTANQFTNDVSVLLNRAGGGFVAMPRSYAGLACGGIAAADLDQDGCTDLVVVDYLPPFFVANERTKQVVPGVYPMRRIADVAVLYGRGDGTFNSPYLRTTTGAAPVAVAAGDVNGDGRSDLIVANAGSSDISVLLGSGDGTFATASRVPLPAPVSVSGTLVRMQPVKTVLADTNGDGRQDIVVTCRELEFRSDDRSPGTQNSAPAGNELAARLFVYLGLGAGTFEITPARDVLLAKAPQAVLGADLEGTGAVSIVTAEAGDPVGGQLSIVATAGDVPVKHYPLPGRLPTALASGVIDGRPVLVVTTVPSDRPEESAGRVLILEQSREAPSGFSARALVGDVGLMPRGVRLADVDGDGHQDVVVVASKSNRVTIFWGGGLSPFSRSQTIDIGDAPVSVDVITVDGKTAIVTANFQTSDVAVVLQDRFNPRNFTAQQRTPVFDGASAAAVSDFDGDGRQDLAISDGRNGVSILLGSGVGTFADQDATLRQVVNMTLVGATAASMPASQKVTVAPLNSNASLDTLTIDRGGTVNARYDGDSTTYGLEVPTRILPAGSIGKGFDVRDMPVSAAVTAAGVAARVGLIDKSRRTLLTATPSGAGDLQNPTLIRPISFLTTAVGQLPTALTGTVTGRSPGLDFLDFNGDRILDVVAVNSSSGTVSVLLGRRDGTFEPQRVKSVGHRPTAVLVVDADGDGNLDIATASDIDKSVTLLLGNGDGAFRSPLTVPLASAPTSFAMADVDTDGRIDIVTVNASTRTATVLRGTAGGTFVATQTLQVGRDPQAVETADFDGDGHLDIVTLDTIDGTVSILYGNSDGSFATKRDVLTVGRLPKSLVAADINGDGRADIVTANTADGTVSVLISTGQFGFAPERVLRVTANPVSVTVADADGDFFPDIVANSTSAVSVLLSGFDGSFTRHRSFPVSFGPTATVAVDVNGDRRIDLVSVNPASDSIAVMLGYGDGTFASREPNLSRLARGVYVPPPAGAAAGGQAESADEIRRATDRLADLNGDGFADLVVSNINSGSIDIFPSGPDGEFLTGRGGQGSFYSSEWQRLSAGTGPSAVLLADINGDDAVDLVSANQVSGDVSVRLGRPGIVGTQFFEAATGFGPEFRYRTSSRIYGYGSDPFSGRGSAIAPQKLSDIALGDVNGDGIVDLVATSTQDRSFTILLGLRGNGGRWVGFGSPERHTARAPITAGPVVATESAEVRDVALGDFDGDGLADIALLDIVKERILLVSSGGGMAFNATPRSLDLTNVIPRSLQVADVGGSANAPDGILDLVVGNDFGDVLTLHGLGDGRFEPPRSSRFSAVRADRSVALLAADVDGDGDEDFVYANKQLDRIDVARDVTQEIFSADQTQGVVAPSGVATVDETVDGRKLKNLVVANGGGNEIIVFRNAAMDEGAAGTFLPPETFFVGTNPSAVAVGDVNRDGVPDVVVANEGSDDISVMLGTRNAAGRWSLKAGPRLAANGKTPVGIAVGDFVTAAGTRGTDGLQDIAVTNRGSNSANIIAGLSGGFFNDRGAIPLVLPPNGGGGPIVTTPDRIVIGNNSLGSFTAFNTKSPGQSGAIFDSFSSRPTGGGSVSLAVTTLGGTTFLAVGNSAAGSVSQFLARPGSIDFAFDRSDRLLDVTGLAYAGRGLFGMSPARTAALELFAFEGRDTESDSLTAEVNRLRGAVQFIVSRTSAVALVATIGSLRNATGTAAAEKAAEKELTDESKSDSVDGGSEAAEKNGDKAAEPSEKGSGGTDVKEAINKAAADSPLLDGFFGGHAAAEKDLAESAAELLRAVIAAEGARTAAGGGGVDARETAPPVPQATEAAPAAQPAAGGSTDARGRAQPPNQAGGNPGRGDAESPRANPASGARVGPGGWGAWAVRSAGAAPTAVFGWFATRPVAGSRRRRRPQPQRIRPPALQPPFSSRD